MKKAIPLIVAIALIGMGTYFFVMAGASPASVANDFMIALAKGDAKGLAKLGYMAGMTPEQEEKIWAQTIERGEYYRFGWHIKSASEANEEKASVVMDFMKNADLPGGYPEDFQLPMVKVDGKWKVDVHGIPRELYPALPR